MNEFSIDTDQIPYYAKQCGWKFEFDIPCTDEPDDYYYYHNNTEVQQAWEETIELAIEWLKDQGLITPIFNSKTRFTYVIKRKNASK